MNVTFFLLKHDFQELILSENKLQYKYQILRKSQLEITLQNSTITQRSLCKTHFAKLENVFDTQNHQFFPAPAPAESLPLCNALSSKKKLLRLVLCSYQQEETSALRAITLQASARELYELSS